MPITKNLQKLSKAKSSNQLHAKSRKLKQLNRAQLRENRLAQQKSVSSHIQDKKTARFKFFQGLIKDSDQQSYTDAEIHDFISQYIDRDLDELEALKAARRPGRPATKRQDELTEAIEKDNKEYDSGLTIPDLTDSENVTALRDWKGDMAKMSLIKRVKVVRQ